MLFSSNVFLFLFLPGVLLGYHLLGRFGRVAVTSWLSLASLFFYGYWNPRYLGLLLCSILMNFCVSRIIAATKNERMRTYVLVAGVSANLALLVWFKYLFPTLAYFHDAGWIGHSFGSVVLPLGISFFTFTQIAYLVDLRQGSAEPTGILSYVLFVTFFPHLIAGPILHHKQMMPQFAVERRGGLRADDMAVGFTWFLLGLAKKVLIADRYAPVADAFYANPHAFNAQASWAGALAYALQLYFDFSGYSDMALGLARMFSVTFPMNFNSPYKAENINEFWQRWHMTLTQYVFSYVYGPIQMAVSRWRQDRGLKVSRKAQSTFGGMTQLIIFPTLVVMLVVGVWHGAGRQYLLYGLINGVLLAGHHIWRLKVPPENILRRVLITPVSVLMTFVAMIFSFAMFRSESVHQALVAYAGMLGRHPWGSGLSGYATLKGDSFVSLTASHFWLEVCLMMLLVWLFPNTQQIMGQVASTEEDKSVLGGRLRWQPSVVWAMVMIVITAATLLFVRHSTSFLYFQF